MAIQILKALSPARVVALDVAQEKLRLAREVGADEAVESGEGAADAVREITGGRGAELVLDVVGSDQTLALSAQLTSFESDLTLLGIAGGVASLRFSSRFRMSAGSRPRTGAARSS